MRARGLFTLLWVLALLFIIASLIALMSGWDAGVKAGGLAVCGALGILFVVHFTRSHQERAAPAPALRAEHAELLGEVHTLMTGRLKELEKTVIAPQADLAHLGETELRLVQANEYSLAGALARHPEWIVSESLLLGQALNRACKLARCRGGAAFAWEKEKPARLAAMSGYDPPATAPPVELAGSEREALLAGRCVSRPAGKDPAALFAQPGHRLAVPVQLPGYAWGWFFLEDHDRKNAAPVEKLLLALGRETAAALATATAWRQLRAGLEPLLAAGSRPLEARGNRRPGRGHRVAELFQAAAPLAGLSEAENESGRLAATLLSLGELAVPELILNQANALTPPEKKFLESHPTHAIRLLRQLLRLEALEEPLFAWREWANGEGYPRRLPLERIPRPARLLAVCDAYDEVLSAGLGKPDFIPAKASEMLKAGAGVIFDPAMVEAVLKVIDHQAIVQLWMGSRGE